MPQNAPSRFGQPMSSRRSVLKRAATATGGALLGAFSDHPASTAATTFAYDEYSKFDALGLAELVRRKEVTAEELLDAAIARLEAVEPQLNAIAGKMYDLARQSIHSGLPNGPFTGVPFLLKDLSFPMAGVESSSGSSLFRNRMSPSDSTLVSRYRQAGLVLFARTQVPELGILPTTESTLAGVTRNPYDLARTPGGSSGGSAAAVAARIAPMASASDGGGSIRIPASCCGLFGLKPTRARVPAGPDSFESWGGLATLHAVTRSVRDSAALLDASAGRASGDPYNAPAPRGPYLDEVAKKPKKLRVALVMTMPPTDEVHPDCVDAVEKAAKLCMALGHDVVDRTNDFSQRFLFRELRQSHGKIVLVSVRRKVLARLKELGQDLRDDALEPVTRFYFDYAERYTGVETEDARATFHRASRIMSDFQSDFDVIMTPTLATPPVKHGEITMTGSSNAVLEGLLKFMPCTPMANWTGQPAMSVPLHQSGNGLPIGVQFLGRFGDEATLFRLAAQLENAAPWHERIPNL